MTAPLGWGKRVDELKRFDILREEDAAARVVARREYDRPLVLEAGAGTGKTAVLVARMVVWCVGRGWERTAGETGPGREEPIARRTLERAVAITFTERAAAEMEERVVSAFEALTFGRPVIGLPREEIALSDPVLRERAGALAGASDALRISTIHGFCRRLLADAGLAAGVHPAFTVDASGDAVARLVDEVLSERLRSVYGDPGDSRYEALAAAGIGPPELAANLRAALREGVPALAFTGLVGSERVQAAKSRLDEALRGLIAEMAALGGGARSRKLARALHARAVAESLREQLHEMRDGAALAALARDDELTAPLCERLMRWSRGSFGVAEQERFLERSGAVRAASERLLLQLQVLRSTDPRVLELYGSVLGELVYEARERLRRRGILVFPDLLRFSRDLLADDIRMRDAVRRGLDLLLVDEFQDTDPLQCEILHMLALSGAPRDRPALFLVGDPKQSIYGWRSADMQAYESFVAQVEREGGRRYLLCCNYRSDAPILSEVSRVLAPAMIAEAGVQPPFQALVPERPAAPAGSEALTPVAYWAALDPGEEPTLSAAAARELEARALAADLERVHDELGVEWRDCAVLMRTTTQQEVYLAALRAAGIPYAVERDRQFFRRREIMDASALVRAMLDPWDELALLALLRSRVVGVPDAAIPGLWAGDFAGVLAQTELSDASAMAPVEALVASVASTTPGERTGWRERLSALARAVRTLRRERDRAAADLWLEALRELAPLEVHEAARYLGAHRLELLERFYEGVREALGSDEGADALLRRLREAVSAAREEECAGPGADAADAVRVMSIHKAKGLTFECVYLVGMHTRTSSRVASGAVDFAEVAPGRWEMRVGRISSFGFDQVLARRREVERAETVRTLYVAMTRPRRRLVLSAKWPSGETPARSGRLAHVQLLADRQGGVPELAQLARDGGAPPVLRGEHGVEWVVLTAPGPTGAAGVGRREPRREVRIGEEEIAAVALAREEAARVMNEPLVVPVTGASAPTREGQAGRSMRAPGDEVSASHGADGRSAAAAALAGHAVHRLLESLVLDRTVRAQLVACTGRLSSYLTMARGDERAELIRAEALALAATAVERMLRGGQILGRLEDLGDRLLGREVPLVLAEGKLTRVGAIDLLYQHEDGARVVVVDYKTDRVSSPAEIHRATARHAAQASAYREAVLRALAPAAEPCVELWFLWADALVTV